jgi:hypothetical protein
MLLPRNQHVRYSRTFYLLGCCRKLKNYTCGRFPWNCCEWHLHLGPPQDKNRDIREDMCPVGEVLVYEVTWVGVARCWNRLVVVHVLAQLRDEVCWVHWMLDWRH